MHSPPTDPLTRIGRRYGTDKVEHGFCAFYDEHLDASRGRVRKVLEIGVFQGASLQMWRDYFPRATIHGLDTRLPDLGATTRIRLPL